MWTCCRGWTSRSHHTNAFRAVGTRSSYYPTMAREYCSNVDTWLTSLLQARHDSLVRSALDFSLAKLTRDEWLDSDEYHAESQALDIGCTHGVTAIRSGERRTAKLLTGSTNVPKTSLPQLTVQRRTMHCMESGKESFKSSGPSNQANREFRSAIPYFLPEQCAQPWLSLFRLDYNRGTTYIS